jgi:hypothetical protein
MKKRMSRCLYRPAYGEYWSNSFSTSLISARARLRQRFSAVKLCRSLKINVSIATKLALARPSQW